MKGICVIVFDLGCDRNHRFEGWFDSGEDFERQLQEKLLVCPLCGSGKVARLPHASHVGTGSVERREKSQRPVSGAPQQYANLGTEVLARLIDHIIETVEDVGTAFPEEARRIHYHEIPERHIRGTASSKEIEALKEEGIDIVALPLPSHRAGKIH